MKITAPFLRPGGRGAVEPEIARRFPDSELRDTRVWFQSGLNTDGAHNPITTRRLKEGDILSLITFPMISGIEGTPEAI